MKHEKGWAWPDADEFMVSQLATDGSYQRSHLDDALTHITDWSIAVDAGAHAGTWSRLLSPRFARVLAFEPSPDTFEALEANMAAFGCANVEAQNVALGAAACYVSMTIDETNAARKNTAIPAMRTRAPTIR